MNQSSGTLLIIRPLTYQGEQVLQKQWPAFVQTFRNLLSQNGIETNDSNEELILLHYDHPFAALTSYFESLDLMKKQKWQKDWGAVPVQAIIHLAKKNEHPPFRDPSASLWGVLSHETVHVSRHLKLQWEQIFAGKKLPKHTFQDVDAGLFAVNFAADVATIKREKLFHNRYVAAQGNLPVCFYCGMSSHKPSACPSKIMAMDNKGINLVGYNPLSVVDDLFKKVIVGQRQMEKLVANNITAKQIRKEPAVQVFLAYFDLYLIYQPRFLWYIAFSLHPAWDGTGKLDRVKVDSRNIQSGLDCLRIGQYKQAASFFHSESQVMGGRQFYATIGQAFIALERGRGGDMNHFLEMANSMATTEKEKIYISLLLSRYHAIVGHEWKADQILQSVANLYVDCQEIIYCKAQAYAAEGNGHQSVQFLRSLASKDRRFFIAALMDPVLLPINGLVDDMLTSLVQAKTKVASENLHKALDEYEDLKSWFGADDDDELVTNLNVLSNLEEQYQRKSLFDIIDVAERAKVLYQACPRLRETRLEGLNEKVDQIVLDWMKYGEQWRAYPYKTFFGSYQSVLQRCKRKLVEARSVAGESLSQAQARMRTSIKLMGQLNIMLGRMSKLKMAFDTARAYLRKLAFSEMVFLAIAVLAYPVLTIALADSINLDLLNLLRDPRIQRKCLFVIAALIAPLFALVLTMRSMKK